MTTIDSKSTVRRTSVLSPAAYRIPWHVDRRLAPTYRLVNRSTEPLWGVSLSVSGAAVIHATAPRRLKPGECLAVTVRGRDIQRDTVLIVRWFRQNGDEYLWRVTL
ncbi:hypothetical protein [Glaciibacter superstes]|uniref:hypothetical protein n=1 Tax=Glaciibacter superstes TaxID=501023 RepID=UPI0003B67D51|nr:hypothetical protein [Glaciibacter superstes]